MTTLFNPNVGWWLSLLFLLLACTQRSDMTAKQHSITFLALGDSYTIGEGVDEADRWPVQLAGLLRRAGIDVADPAIIAKTGWTTDELQAAIRAANNQKQYELVSLLIGVNNQYRGWPLTTYRAEFRALLQTAIQFAGKRSERVLVLSIPDWGASPFAEGRDRAQIARAIDQFNAVAQDECRRAGVAFIDITPLTRQATGSPAADADQFAPDGLHYSGLHMRRWAEAALPVAKQRLAR